MDAQGVLIRKEKDPDRVHAVHYVVSDDDKAGRNLLSNSNQAVEEKREDRNEESEGERLVSRMMNRQKRSKNIMGGEEKRSQTQSVPKLGEEKTIVSHLARPLQFESRFQLTCLELRRCLSSACIKYSWAVNHHRRSSALIAAADSLHYRRGDLSPGLTWRQVCCARPDGGGTTTQFVTEHARAHAQTRTQAEVVERHVGLT